MGSPLMLKRTREPMKYQVLQGTLGTARSSSVKFLSEIG